MPSSLTRVLSSALGYSPRPPVSVYGTVGTDVNSAGSISWKHGVNQFVGNLVPSSSLFEDSDGPFVALKPPRPPPYELERRIRRSLAIMAMTYPSPSSLRHNPYRCRNINLLPITYAFRPRLRNRLTHGRIILPQETLGLRRQDFSSCLSLLMPA